MIRFPATERGRFWQTVPLRSTIVFYLGVFNLFAIFGILTDILRLGRQPIPVMLAGAAIAGGFAVIYAFLAIRDPRYILLVMPFQFLLYGKYRDLATFLPARGLSGTVDAVALRDRLTLDIWIIYFCVVLGYVLFIRFIRFEGKRYFASHAEIALAKEIHQHLVPAVSQRIAGFDFYGESLPSGEVGGDLVDLVPSDGRWLGLIVDVSGHGVSSGVLMAMIKSATRMKPSLEESAGRLFADINKVIYDLKKSNMFATAASVRFDGAAEVECCLAGHLPILHYRAASRDVAEISVANVPLGLFEEMPFASVRVPVHPGDLLVLITDGIAETTSKQGEEFGLERIKQDVITRADSPLPALAAHIMDAVKQYGPQDDDRSLLLIRKE